LKNEDTESTMKLNLRIFFIFADLYEKDQFCKSLCGNFLHLRHESRPLGSSSSWQVFSLG